MHKFSKTIALAGAAMAVAMTPAMAGAQDQATPPMDHSDHQEAPASMPQTGPVTSPPANPETGAPVDDMDSTGTAVEPLGTDPVTDGTTTTTSTTSTTSTTTTDRAPASTPEEQQAAIQTWPAATQAYYQSLTAERQQMFWALTDTDKVRLSELPEEQRELAWAQIEAQIKGAQG